MIQKEAQEIPTLNKEPLDQLMDEVEATSEKNADDEIREIKEKLER